MAELRREPVLQRWVVIRGDRWDTLTETMRKGQNAHEAPCPFCPGHEHETPPEIFALRKPGAPSNQGGWTVRVVPNKFPALRIEGEIARSGEGIFDRVSAIGAHEIVIETPSHIADWDAMAVENVAGVLTAYRARSLDLRGDERFLQILIARNYGPGLTLLAHPHSHIVALPVVPMRIQDEVRGVLEYHDRKERCAYCDMIRQELKSGERVIRETATFLAVAPFAARYPFETWILPKVHAHDFGGIGLEQILELAGLFQRVTDALRAVVPDLAYSLVFHSSPLQRYVEPRYHWHIEVRVRLPVGGGFEWGTGFFINPLAPEEAARLLRGEARGTQPADSSTRRSEP